MEIVGEDGLCIPAGSWQVIERLPANFPQEDFCAVYEVYWLIP